MDNKVNENEDIKDINELINEAQSILDDLDISYDEI